MTLFGFSNTEDAIKTEVLSHYSDYIKNAQYITVDAEMSIRAMLAGGDSYCASLEYELAPSQTNDKFRGNGWIYLFTLILIHHCEKTTMHERVRDLIDLSQTFLVDKERLYHPTTGEPRVKKAYVNQIGIYRPLTVGERNFFLLPVGIEVWDTDDARR